jgi:hypothetical protein
MRGQNASDGRAASSWLRIDTSTPGYAGRIVPIVAEIARTPSNRPILEGIRASGSIVKIERPAATEPPNAWVIPDDLAAAANGSGCGSTIFFDPANWPRPGDPRSPQSVEILLGLFREAHLFASGRGELGKPGWAASAKSDR